MRRNSLEKDIITKIMQLNWPVIGLLTLLSMIGFMMMYSAGNGAFDPWASRQIIRFVIAFIVMIAIAITPIQLLLRHAYTVYFICLAMLIIVEIIGFIGMGAQRWVNIGFFNIQPSELMKVAVILVIARYFHGMHPDDVNRPLLMLPPILMIAIPAAFILRQPNLGTATILCSVGAIMFFMAGVRIRYFVYVAIPVIAAMPLGWHFLHDYQKRRILTFLDPQQDPLGAGYNIMQSIIAIGSGGLFGKGFLQGSQGQLDFLPEKQTDFVFTMLAEEFGFIGSVVLLLLYTALMAYSIGIGLRSRSLFGSLLSVGVVAMLFVHIMINVAMVMGMIPVVGVPLPLLSYGGSIMFSTLMGFGLVLNAYVHRDIDVNRGL